MELTAQYAVTTHVDWNPAAKNPSTDAANYGLQGFEPFIQNAGQCYKTDAEGVTTATGTACKYEQLDIDAYCHEACKTNSLDVQACGDMESGCITTGPKAHWMQSGCDGGAG